ncbi:hypothetical protein BIV57_00770 [Mangrovactinospora gilvigrisea]|uniref:Low molecular weight protein antigen 6 PH domain-containing protein n=1 Tax=Mangrovactinospora gilvigrisea TaxID=1428644 RepID=A0A1J7BL39_9ACTN|nr:hypothetical protein BIV57_00770 [Mangrovactinospora gilvigrisea]
MVCGGPWFLNWVLGAFLTVLWVACVLCVYVPDLYGTTELTEQGLRLRTPYRRRLIRWAEVTGIVEQESDGKGGIRKVVVAQRVDRKPVVLPATRSFQSDRARWEDFDRRFRDIYIYWYQNGRGARPPA